MTNESTNAAAAALPAPRRGRPMGEDLRALAVAAALREGGRAAARRFGLAESTVNGWVRRFRERGHVRPDSMGGRPSRIGRERERILRILAARPELSLTGLRDALAADGAVFALSTVHRFLKRHGLDRKTRRARSRGEWGGAR